MCNCSPVWRPHRGSGPIVRLHQTPAAAEHKAGPHNPESRFSPVHSGIIIIIILPMFILLCLPRIFKKPCSWRPAEAFPGLSRLLCPHRGNERGLMAAVRLLQAFLWHDLIGGTLRGPGCGEDKAERDHCTELSVRRTDGERAGDIHDITGGVAPVRHRSLSHMCATRWPSF